MDNQAHFWADLTGGILIQVMNEKGQSGASRIIVRNNKLVSSSALHILNSILANVNQAFGPE